MNERIKAVLLNARNMFVNGVTEIDGKIYIHGSEENLEKIGKLIMKECIEQVITGPNGPAHYAVEAALRLKKHFGVEE